MVVVAFLSDQLFYQITAFAVVFLGSHHGGFEAEAEAHCDAVCERSGEGLWIKLEIEFGEKSERAQGECNGGWNDALEEP